MRALLAVHPDSRRRGARPGTCYGRRSSASADFVLTHLAVERVAADAERLRRSAAVAARGTQGAGHGLSATCREIADMTLFPKADSWIFGANVPGKKNAVMFYMAGIGAYRKKLGEVARNDYEGFELSRRTETAGV